MKKPLIFVTNDDGVGAKGFACAIEVARKFGRVVAVGPELSQSGQSHAISMYNPLYLRKVREEEDLIVYACAGTPVDCVKIAFDYLLVDDMPTLSLSGINHGSNSSIAVIYSGTMGAAVEASFYNIPSIGLSLTTHDPEADFDAAMQYAERIVGEVLEAHVQTPLCLNVNFPVCRPEEINGIKLCRQNKGYFRERFERRLDPHGREYFWLTGDLLNMEPESTDTDEYALAHNYVAVVPVQVDMTDHEQVNQLNGIII